MSATRRARTPLRVELPLIGFLTAFWMIIWRWWEPGGIITGFLVAVVVVRLFPLPPLRGSGRFNIYWALVFAVRFLGQMVMGSLTVTWIILTKGAKVHNSIISIQLRSHDDLIVTFTGHALALVPGSLVVEVDRTTATLYLHTIDVTDENDAEAIRQDALRTEALLIRAAGNRSDNAVVKAERRLGRTAGFSKAERDELLAAAKQRRNSDAA